MTALDPAPTALIADDEPPLARALVAQLARAWPALRVVHVARHGLEAAERIAALQPDVAFLDIQMPGLSGLEVAEGIEGPTRVVFVTAYDAHAVQAFEQEAIDYVLKPVSDERLARSVARLQRLLGAGRATPDADTPDARRPTAGRAAQTGPDAGSATAASHTAALDPRQPGRADAPDSAGPGAVLPGR